MMLDYHSGYYISHIKLVARSLSTSFAMKTLFTILNVLHFYFTFFLSKFIKRLWWMTIFFILSISLWLPVNTMIYMARRFFRPFLSICSICVPILVVVLGLVRSNSKNSNGLLATPYCKFSSSCGSTLRLRSMYIWVGYLGLTFFFQGTYVRSCRFHLLYIAFLN